MQSDFSPFLRATARFRRAALILAAAGMLAACQQSGVPKHMIPVSSAMKAKMAQLNMDEKAPVYIRLFKESSELEVWKERRDGKYGLLKTYEICKWSGKLGPKIKEGDRQAPEGFYTVVPAQMNPNSSYYLSFNIGYPNAYDRSLGRTGTNLMVHGACSSAGCYSMTDQSAGEIYGLARDAFMGGQRSFEVHAFPFKMTAENMAIHRNDPNVPFWRMLKEGYDHFELTRKVPAVGVCDHRYVFNADPGTATFNASAACPAYTVPAWLDAAVKEKEAKDNAQIAALSAKLDAEANVAAAREAEKAEKAAAVAAREAEVVPTTAFAATTGASPAGPAIGGEPAPGVPLPVPSPLRASQPAAAEVPADAPKPGFFTRMKKIWG